jgi:hypothetical protein
MEVIFHPTYYFTVNFSLKSILINTQKSGRIFMEGKW